MAAPTKIDPTSPASKSAKQGLLDMLSAWGLTALGTQIWNEYLQGTPMDKIMADIRASDTYKQRFPGMDALSKGGHAINEAEYIAKEAADISLMHAYGLPTKLTSDRAFLGRLIGSQVSTAELQTRLDEYQQTVLQLPQEVRDYARDQGGVNVGDWMHFWLNPDEALPAIQQKAQAAQVGGAASLAGYGALDWHQALHLAGLGVGFNQAMTGFEKAGELRGLTDTLPGQQHGVTGDQLVDAEVGGDAQAALAVDAEQRRRLAQFKDGGQFATTAQGAVGAGVSNP